MYRSGNGRYFLAAFAPPEGRWGALTELGAGEGQESEGEGEGEGTGEREGGAEGVDPGGGEVTGGGGVPFQRKLSAYLIGPDAASCRLTCEVS